MDPKTTAQGVHRLTTISMQLYRVVYKKKSALAQWWARSVGEDNISRRQHCSLVERTKSLMVHQHRCGGSRDLLKPRATNIRAIYLSVSLCVHHRVTWFKTDHLRLRSTVDIFPGLIVSKSTVFGGTGERLMRTPQLTGMESLHPCSTLRVSLSWMFMPVSYTYVVWDWCMDFNPPLTLT